MANQAPNNSFEIDLSEWQHASGTAPTLTRVASAGGLHGSWSMKVTNAGVTQNITVRTPSSTGLLVPVAPTEVWSIGVKGLWVTGTPKALRADLRWMTGATTESATQPSNGNSVTMNTSTPVQSLVEGATAPADALGLRIRVVVVSGAPGDEFLIDEIQMEKAATLPVFDDGTTGGTVWTRGLSIIIGG